MPADQPTPLIPFDPSIDSWPGASSLATACFINMGFLFSRVQALVEALVRRHVLPSSTAFNILTILDGAGRPRPPPTVAQRILMPRGTVTSVVDSLVKHGLVERQPDPADGRRVFLALSDEGRRRATSARRELHQF